MMRNLLTFLTVFLYSISALSQMRAPDKRIELKGSLGYFYENPVSARMTWNNTLVTTFYTNMENVTVTVKNEKGEIISSQTMSVEEFNTFQVKINDYVPGNYILEIDTPEGGLVGQF